MDDDPVSKYKTGIKISPELLDSERIGEKILSSISEQLAKAMDEQMMNPEQEQREPPPPHDWKADMRLTGSNSGLACPGCGRPGLWVEQGDGDYYQGPTHWCREDKGGCGRTWSIQ